MCVQGMYVGTYMLVWARVEGSTLVPVPHCFVDTLTSEVE